MNTKTNITFCQSCGMPMTDPEAWGTEADGGKSADYCSYCYGEGAFLGDMNLDEMIDICAGPMAEHNPGMTLEEAKTAMRGFLPTLKRWKNT